MIGKISANEVNFCFVLKIDNMSTRVAAHVPFEIKGILMRTMVT